jgi:hypothetical protein
VVVVVVAAPVGAVLEEAGLDPVVAVPPVVVDDAVEVVGADDLVVVGAAEVEVVEWGVDVVATPTTTFCGASVRTWR